ncbi:WXG100 family type VII secretion target [Nocardia seriolae]|uniref:WXG100 family type VII secretion target n=1 Tax=Nocardia seriolae TaxID=37332 RepID=A0A0B8NND2_9NOCA|nr:hypothetical protein [Nocardia seriolae]APA97248.1 hypothetical protein NS506_03195 [Nocardia seriolae]MTJ62175.1 hypothetical protein [Nocardia seriolae]MTJ74634.1 hypothetical protein [Nocardia seriolae]MTJ87086.1 hypothetical protein [Nocardia seriolae]MTK31080.1 hypothetical protein [Nocardia seriolae]
MTGKVEVEIQQLRTVGGSLDAVSARIDAIIAKVSSASTAYKGSWGSDEFGQSFSGGDNGYIKSDENLQTVLKSKVALLNSYSKGLTDAATALQSAEDSNTDSFW